MADWGDSFELRVFLVHDGLESHDGRDVRRVPPVVRAVYHATRPAHGDGSPALPAREALRGAWTNAVPWGQVVRGADARASVASPEGLALG